MAVKVLKLKIKGKKHKKSGVQMVLTIFLCWHPLKGASFSIDYDQDVTMLNIFRCLTSSSRSMCKHFGKGLSSFLLLSTKGFMIHFCSIIGCLHHF